METRGGIADADLERIGSGQLSRISRNVGVVAVVVDDHLTVSRTADHRVGEVVTVAVGGIERAMNDTIETRGALGRTQGRCVIEEQRDQWIR